MTSLVDGRTEFYEPNENDVNSTDTRAFVNVRRLICPLGNSRILFPYSLELCLIGFNQKFAND